MNVRPADHEARRSITEDTDRTLFVNAGAGSGKTTTLVRRIRTLVLRDGVTLASIAAVTFTEKAGAELRHRLRAEFERSGHSDQSTRRRAQQALDDLDGAAIGTLHAFCRRLLTEHPVEAGLPPMFQVLDEVASNAAADERWARLQTDLLDDNAVAEALLTGLAAGVKLDDFRLLTRQLTNSWDLIPTHVLAETHPSVEPPALDAFVQRLRNYVAVRDHCTDELDRLLAKLDEVAAVTDRLAAATDTETRLLALKQLSGYSYTQGRASSWASAPGGKADVASQGAELSTGAREMFAATTDASLRVLTQWLAAHVVAAAEQRRREGVLDFHDLLVLTRDLLRCNPDVRAAARHDYQRILLDEFQDTDAIQIEIAARICGGRDADAADWRNIVVPDGSLFVVGDAKQSIYRFRRASIGTYLDAQQHVGQALSLTTNFRTVAPTLRWINTVFSALMQPEPDAQPDYEPLREQRTDTGVGPAVTLLGADGHDDRPNAATLRQREATDVAACITRILAAEWTVRDRDTDSWRPARLDDIAVLVPTRTSIPTLADALEAAGIPYAPAANVTLHQAEEVQGLHAAARSLSDRTDAFALITALRSSLFACGDDDLWAWKRDGGNFSLTSDIPDALTNTPVGVAVSYLQQLRGQALWSSPSELLSRLATDRRMFEVAATGPHAREEWQRIRQVIDQARAWAERTNGGLRAYLAWVAQQEQATNRAAEAALPETDTAAVQLLTVHAAKGLEFPIVVMSGMTSRSNQARGATLLWTKDGYEFRANTATRTSQFEEASTADIRTSELERIRLLYVAATRARDHLVVSLHRDTRSNYNTPASIVASTPGVTRGADCFAPGSSDVRRRRLVTSRPVAVPPPAWVPWKARHDAALTRSRKRPAITASELEGSRPNPATGGQVLTRGLGNARDLEPPAWLDGVDGSSIGRAVHAVLHIVDLATGKGLRAAVQAEVLVEGIIGHEETVAGLTRSALRSEIVTRAAEREHWRETYVGTTRADGTVLEGYVDLIYREDDGTLVIVDYKTDAIPTQAINSRVAYYKPQIDAYREAVDAATGASCSAKLLFLHSTAPAVAVGT